MSRRVSSIPPTLIQIGGVAQVAALVKQYGGKSAFIVTDKGLTKAGVTGKVTAILEKAELPFCVFDDIMANPTASVINAGAKLLKNYGPSPVVITLGGGSSMDAGKAIATVAKSGDDIVQFCFNPRFDEKTKNLDRASMLPKAFAMDAFKIIAIPTTSGTATQARWCVVLRSSRQIGRRKSPAVH